MDVDGNWGSSKKFSLSESAYGLELDGVKFPDGDKSYSDLIESFKGDFANKSARGATRDFAWNLMFASSYAQTTYDSGGVANIFVNADARIIYNQPVWGGGITNAYNPCIIPDTLFYSENGNFVMEVSNIKNNQTWNPCRYHFAASDMAYDTVNKPSTLKIEIDSVTITTAIAVNQGLRSLDSLTYVPSGTNPLYSNYIDGFYLPMQSIQCIKPTEWIKDGTHWPYPNDTLCLVHFGNTWALPVMTHSGSYTYSKCWFPYQCKCSNPRDKAGSNCNHMDVTVGLIFFQFAYWYTGVGSNRKLVDMMITAYNNNPTDPDQGLVDLLYPSLAASYIASSFWAQSKFSYQYDLSYYSDPECPLSADDALYNAVYSLCGAECTILHFEMQSGYDANYGAKINEGGYLLNNLSCSDAFFHKDVFETMQKTPPADTIQKYQVCRNSMTQAVSDGVSNAFASAGLYTAVLMAIVMFLVVHAHNRVYPDKKLISTDDGTANARNATALVLDALLDKADMCDDERNGLKDQLNDIFILDAGEYIDDFHMSRKTHMAVETTSNKESSKGFGDEETGGEGEFAPPSGGTVAAYEMVPSGGSGRSAKEEADMEANGYSIRGVHAVSEI
eukprot:gene23947-30231_t